MEKKHSRQHQGARNQDDRANAQPLGKTSLTSQIRRKADGNGVQAHAEEALDRAANSTGAPLPTTLQSKFETSLGADLSNVRIHTGSESAAAASSVSARAYTVGSDIHFNAGQYDPHSAAGQHLIAHEVAHTVQQSGHSDRKPMFKLDVSNPGDSHEIAADRAADAMVVGAPAHVTTAPSTVSREVLNVPEVVIQGGESEYDGRSSIKPVFFAISDGDGPEALVSGWNTPMRNNNALPQQGSGESLDSITAARQAFSAVWQTVQGAWNAAVPTAKRYMDAQKDAEAKGIDFGHEEGDINIGAESRTFTTNTPLINTFDVQGNVLKPGQTPFKDPGKVSQTSKKEILDAKQVVQESDRAISVQNIEIEKAGNNVVAAKNGLFNANMTLKQLEEENKLPAPERQAAAFAKSAGLIKDCVDAIGSFTKGGVEAKSLNEGGLATVKIINTLYWEDKIEEINHQIQFIQGGIQGIKLQIAKTNIESATYALQNAVAALKQASIGYESKVAARAQQYKNLALKMQNAAGQSGLDKKDADKVFVAIAAKPLMELALTASEELYNALPTALPAPNALAEKGCALTVNREELISRYGTLATTRRITKIAIDKWKKRLATAQRIINLAHD
jgi:hypothetical protein